MLRRPNVRVRPKPALLFHSLLHVALCHVRLSTRLLGATDSIYTISPPILPAGESGGPAGAGVPNPHSHH